MYDDSAAYYETRDKKLVTEKKAALKHIQSCAKSRRKRKNKRK